MKKVLLILFLFIISTVSSYSQKIIEMEYENGVYYVPCKVNGVAMKFIFDTGASDVTISLTEAMFLLKQGALKETDFKGSIKYQIANGDIQEGTKFIIKEIDIDGIIINDIEASVVHELDAPLLLGQSAISKLGTIILDGNKLFIDRSTLNEVEENVIEESLETKRAKWIEIINKGFKKFTNGKESMIRFSRTEDDNFNVYIQDRLDVNSKTFQKSGHENSYVDRICYVTSHLIFEDEFVKNFIINELKYKKLIFNIELTYNNRKRVEITKTIYQLNLKSLKIPFTEGEFYKILF